jgi:RimJ/RimL family protein N-acetyltransferase
VREGPLLTTARYELWCPRGPDDVPSLYRLIEDEETRRFLGRVGDPTLQGQWERLMRNAGSWSLYGYGVFYVRPHRSEEIAGSVGVFHSWRGLDARMDQQPEAGWIVRRDFSGQGLAAEAMAAVLAWFEATHGAQRIVAMIEHGNLASERLAAKFGFAAFAEHIDTEGKQLNLYERLPSAGAEKG